MADDVLRRLAGLITPPDRYGFTPAVHRFVGDADV
jgi:hypothetical protein